MISLLPAQLFLFDPLALFFLAVIILVSAPSAIFAAGYLRAEPAGTKAIAWALLAAFVLSMCLVVTSGNIFSFLIFWELMSLASYLLVVFDFKRARSIRAGTIYLVMTHAGTACLIAGFFILYRHAGSFDYSAVKHAAVSLAPRTRDTVFLLLLTGFAVKAGAVPLHIWLPYAHPQAPSHVSSIMSGVMIKIAIYGMIRFLIMIVGPPRAWWGLAIMALGAASCLVGILYALADADLKRLLAYSSVENIGIVLLAIGAAIFFMARCVPAIAALCLSAGLYHLMNHAFFKGLLFLASGSVLKATGLRDMEKMGGLIKTMPVTALLFLIGAMGAAALPPFNGFVSEWLIFQAFFAGILRSQGWDRVLMVLSAATLALTGALAAACFVKAFGITFLAQPRSSRAREAKESVLPMKAGMAMLAVLVIASGIGAGVVIPLLRRVMGSVLGAEFSLGDFYLVSTVPLFIVALLVCIGGAIFLWFRFGLRRSRSVCATWDCGYYSLDSRAEYTATAFSKPFRIAFSFFLLPYRKSEKIRDSLYHVRKFTYETHTTPVFRRYFYEPAVRLVYIVALKIRRLQPGSIHLYLMYIFVTLIVMLSIGAIFQP